MHLKNGAFLQDGKYRIEKTLGQGGFGITYLAIQSGLNRKVAIKEFFMKDLCNRDARTNHVSVPSIGSQTLVSRFKDKFLKEASTIAKMENDHIVRIYDIFEENGTAYYVMEYLGEDNLQSRIPALGMPYQDAVGYIRQIASALGYIHSQNILHLDIKPSNVLFRKGTDAVLIDFGVSKHYDGEGGSQTSSTPVGLSRGYAPLEQNMTGGVSQFTPSTDIYALAATFYKLVTGHTPPEAEYVNENGLRAFPSSVPSEIASVIEKAMQPKRKDRPQSINEFLAILDSALKSIASTRNDEPVGPGPIVIQQDIHEHNPVVSLSDYETNLDNESVRGLTTPSQASSKKKSRKWLWWLLALPVVILCAVLILFKGDYSDPAGSSANPSSMSESYTEKTAPDAYLTDTHEAHTWVDLGLSVKWATCNVGASSPEEYGDYFAWGETRPKPTYVEDNSTSFNMAGWGDIGGNSRCDPATANWGGDWRMPTMDEFQELLRECTWEWTTQNGHNGYKVTGPNGQSIFLPAAGWRYGDDKNDVGLNGFYWSSTPDESNTDDAYYLCFFEDCHYVGWLGRYYGRSVRPVLGNKLDDDTIITEDEDECVVALMEYYEDEEEVEELVEEEAIPFQLVEEKPSFQGGDAGTFTNWVNQRLVYPEIAKENGVQGRVILHFIVEKDGSITNVTVLRGVDLSLDNEAIRVVSMSPKWKPGKQEGRTVRVSYTFPVFFELNTAE